MYVPAAVPGLPNLQCWNVPAHVRSSTCTFQQQWNCGSVPGLPNLQSFVPEGGDSLSCCARRAHLWAKPISTGVCIHTRVERGVGVSQQAELGYKVGLEGWIGRRISRGNHKFRAF